MFVSGYELEFKINKNEGKLISLLAILPTIPPFIAGIYLTDWLGWSKFMGEAQHFTSFVLVMGIAFAVTSIPVISKIFIDLGIAGSRFAKIILSVAGILIRRIVEKNQFYSFGNVIKDSTLPQL